MTLVLAHRGAHARLPENSVAAFAEALALGADGVELDVRLTADDHLVVHHDDAVPGVGPVASATRWALPRAIASLDEALDACLGSLVNIEVKRAPSDGASSRTVTLLLELLATRNDRVVVSSFVPTILDEVVAAGAGLDVAWLVAARPGGIDLVAPALERGYTGIHPAREIADEDLVGAAHAAGLAVRPWTVNDPAEVARLAALGVAAVITDEVPAARRALARG
jgi:glycerophosphoryl diester phosphodiesterase